MTKIAEQPQLESALELQRQAFSKLTEALLALDRRLQETEVGDATAHEVGYHELWLRHVAALLEESSQRVAIVKKANDRRFLALAVASENYEMEVPDLGKAFRVDGELLPSVPRAGTPEYDQLVAWLRDRTSGLVVQEIKWTGLKTLCEELAEKGEPPPPHVKLSPRIKVKVNEIHL